MKTFFSFLVATMLTIECALASDRPEKLVVHRYSAGEAGVFTNSYLVETERSVVVVDATLTVRDAMAVRTKLDALGKPLRAILLTHGHPDHYNGARIIRGDSDAPVIATEAVNAVIRRDDAAKTNQWAPQFGSEWPAHRLFPTVTKKNDESIPIDGVRFTVHDLGPGESHADSYWVVSGQGKTYAFIGDLVLNRVHAFVGDGHTADWLANLEKVRLALSGVTSVFPGHGEPGGLEILDWQRDYLNAYRTAVGELQRNGQMGEAQKLELAQRMKAFLPTEKLAFFIGLGADAVTAELNPERNPEFDRIAVKVHAPQKPFSLAVHLEIKPGTAAQFAAAFSPVVEVTRTRKGCLRYELSQSVDNPNIYLLYERWASLPDLEAHMKGPQFPKLLADVGGFLNVRDVRVLLPAAE
jgi:glyoxylase-like metal-dependent hydrolase (beta-lactamase superfamily II)/quinol monooxygenase YgiN